jgi:hypothetical protein
MHIHYNMPEEQSGVGESLPRLIESITTNGGQKIKKPEYHQRSTRVGQQRVGG